MAVTWDHSTREAIPGQTRTGPKFHARRGLKTVGDSRVSEEPSPQGGGSWGKLVVKIAASLEGAVNCTAVVLNTS